MTPAPRYTLELICALAAVPVLWTVAVALRRFLVRRYKLPLGMRYRLAAGALSLHLPLSIYHWVVEGQEAVFSKASKDVAVDGALPPAAPILFPAPFMQLLLASFIFFGALTLAQLVRKYFWDGWFERTTESRAPKFLSDIGTACIVGMAVVFIATGVYHVDLRGFQLSSTVSVAVIGFASQDLLGNLLSGMALQIGSPFRKGDWLLIDGRKLQVQEVNWRSTRMRSPENVLVDVPNKSIAGSTIVNLSAPTRERATSVVVGFDRDSRPEAVKACLLAAARGAASVMPEPHPRAVLKDFADAAVLYELVFWVDSEEAMSEANDAVRTRLWHEAQRAGLKLAQTLPPAPAHTAASRGGLQKKLT